MAWYRYFMECSATSTVLIKGISHKIQPTPKLAHKTENWKLKTSNQKLSHERRLAMLDCKCCAFLEGEPECGCQLCLRLGPSQVLDLRSPLASVSVSVCVDGDVSAIQQLKRTEWTGLPPDCAHLLKVSGCDSDSDPDSALRLNQF